MEYILHLAILICLYTMLAQSLNLVAGNTGLISLAHAGFYGIGAYTTAILSLNFNLPFWFNCLVAMFLSGCIAVLVSLIALRTIEDYFIICTMGIQIVAFSIMNNWVDVTKGPLGITSIPQISFFNFEFNSKLSYLALTVFFTGIIWLILNKLSTSGFGKVLIAISEDEIYTQSIGKNIYLAKISSFTISGVLASIPGTLYAHYISYIDPKSFTLNESIFILSIVIIGGMRNLSGNFLVAAFLILIPEIIRLIGIPYSMAANIRQIIYGVILVIVIMQGENDISLLREKLKSFFRNEL